MVIAGIFPPRRGKGPLRGPLLTWMRQQCARCQDRVRGRSHCIAPLQHTLAPEVGKSALEVLGEALVELFARGGWGGDRAGVETFVSRARARGLETELVEHDLEKVRAGVGYPGEEAARDELVGGRVVVRGGIPDAPRLCIAGHLDVVEPGAEE